MGARTRTERPCRIGRCAAALLATAALTLARPEPAAAQTDWPLLAADSRRTSQALTAPIELTARLWLANVAGGSPLVSEGPTTPVVWNGRVYTVARHFTGASYTHEKIVAWDAATGQYLWQFLAPRGDDPFPFDSWAAPAIDRQAGRLYFGVFKTLYAIDAADGSQAWSRPFVRRLVNSSPAFDDDAHPSRCLIGDYDPFGAASELHCVNVAPFDGGSNPYRPGEVVWSEPIGGASGPTPAVADGVAYVASAAGFSGFPDEGFVWAFDIGAPAGQRLLWSTAVGEGFFGGLAVSGDALFAASYDFDGGADNSTLVKLARADGAVRWTIPAERTSSTPIVSGDLVLLSGGINGFGSAPKVEAFRDLGGSAVKLWDTYADTGGALVVGGWTHQPVLAGQTLFAGRLPAAGGAAPYTDIYLLDVSRTPTDAGFVVQHVAGVGSSPAVANGRLYSLGPAGVQCWAACGDYSGDGRRDGRDVQGFMAALLGGMPTAAEIALGDLNGNMVLDAGDAALLADKLVH
ncbi:MAG: PQQ-binding-like beta-propeller repeat protein [Phycisphaerae bacterium]